MKQVNQQKKKKQPLSVDEYGARTSEIKEKSLYWDIVSDAWIAGEQADPSQTAGIMVLEDGRCELGIRLNPPSRMLMSEENLAARHYNLKSVLQVGIPEGERARIYIRVSPVRVDRFQKLMKNDGGNNDVAQFLVNKRLAKLDGLRRQGQLKEWTFYLTCTVKPSRPFNKENRPTPEQLRAVLKRSQNRRSELLNRLRNAGYEAEPMSVQQIFEEAWYYHNLDFLGGVPPQFMTESVERYRDAPKIDGQPDPLSLKTQVHQTPTRTEDSAFVVSGSTLVYAMSLHELPRITEFGVLNAVAESVTEGNMLFCIEYTHLDFQMKKEGLETSKRGLFSTINSTKYAPSASAQERYRTVSETLELIYKEGDHIHNVGVTVFLFGKYREQLDEMLNQASLAFSRFHSSRPIMHGFQTKALYEAMAPFGGGHTEFPFEAVETNGVGFMPAIAPFQGIGDGTLIYRNRSNALTIFDPYQAGLSASHFLIIAKTGWGKTFNLQGIAVSLINRYDPTLTVIDRKDDLRDMMEALGGQTIAFGGGGDAQLNPMDLPDGDKTPDEGKQSFLTALWRDFIPRGSDERYSGIEDALILESNLITYKSFEQEDLPPLVSDVVNTLQTMSFYSNGDPLSDFEREVARSLATRMRPNIGNTAWGRVIDRHTNVNTAAKYMYYTLERIDTTDERQRKIAMRIIIDRTWQQARTLPRSVKKLLVIEELASQIKTQSDRQYLADFLRLSRAYNMGVGGATQFASDLEFMPELQGSFNYFFFGSLLDASGLIQYLKMPKPVADHVLNLQKVDGQYSEWVLAYRPDNGDVNGEIIRVEESPEFYWLCSSRDSEREPRKAAIKARSGNIIAAIEDLVAGIRPAMAVPAGGGDSSKPPGNPSNLNPVLERKVSA